MVSLAPREAATSEICFPDSASNGFILSDRDDPRPVPRIPSHRHRLRVPGQPNRMLTVDRANNDRIAPVCKTRRLPLFEKTPNWLLPNVPVQDLTNFLAVHNRAA